MILQSVHILIDREGSHWYTATSIIFLSVCIIFSHKNAGKWVASKNGKVVASDPKLDTVMSKIKTRKDRKDIWFALVPKQAHFAG